MNDLIDRLKRGIDSSGGVNAQIYFYQALCDEAAQHIKDHADKIQGLVDACKKSDAIGTLPWDVHQALTTYKEGE